MKMKKDKEIKIWILVLSSFLVGSIFTSLITYYFISKYKFSSNNNNKENIPKKINYTSWSNPYDPQTYTTLRLDITKILPYLKKKEEEIKVHLTPTIFTIKLMSIILKKYPEVYGYIKFGIYDTKEGVDICCLVEVGGGKELANTLSCTQSCIAKNHNRILSLIRKSLEY